MVKWGADVGVMEVDQTSINSSKCDSAETVATTPPSVDSIQPAGPKPKSPFPSVLSSKEVLVNGDVDIKESVEKVFQEERGEVPPGIRDDYSLKQQEETASIDLDKAKTNTVSEKDQSSSVGAADLTFEKPDTPEEVHANKPSDKVAHISSVIDEIEASDGTHLEVNTAKDSESSMLVNCESQKSSNQEPVCLDEVPVTLCDTSKENREQLAGTPVIQSVDENQLVKPTSGANCSGCENQQAAIEKAPTEQPIAQQSVEKEAVDQNPTTETTVAEPTIDPPSSNLISDSINQEQTSIALKLIGNETQLTVGDSCSDPLGSNSIHCDLPQGSQGKSEELSDTTSCDEVITLEEVSLDVSTEEIEVTVEDAAVVDVVSTESTPVEIVCETVEIATEICYSEKETGQFCRSEDSTTSVLSPDIDTLVSREETKSIEFPEKEVHPDCSTSGYIENVEQDTESTVGSKSIHNKLEQCQNSPHSSALPNVSCDPKEIVHLESGSTLCSEKAGSPEELVNESNSIQILRNEVNKSKECKTISHEVQDSANEIQQSTEKVIEDNNSKVSELDQDKTDPKLGGWLSKPAVAGEEQVYDTFKTPSKPSSKSKCDEVRNTSPEFHDQQGQVSVDDAVVGNEIAKTPSANPAEENMECDDQSRDVVVTTSSVAMSPPPVLVNRQVENVRSTSKRAKMSMSPNKGAAAAAATASAGQATKKVTLRPHTARKTLNPPSDRSLRVRRKIKTQEQEGDSSENQENLQVVPLQMTGDLLSNGAKDDALDYCSPSRLKNKTVVSVDPEVSFSIDTDNEESINEALVSAGSPAKHGRISVSNSGLSSLVNGSMDIEESPSNSDELATGGTTTLTRLSNASSDHGVDLSANIKNTVTEDTNSIATTSVPQGEMASMKGSQEPSSVKSTPIKSVPKARKSCQPLPSKQSNSEKAKNQANTSIANMTLRLKEIERSLGIKGQTLAEIDAKTLDRLILQKAQQRRNSLSKKNPKPDVLNSVLPIKSQKTDRSKRSPQSLIKIDASADGEKKDHLLQLENSMAALSEPKKELASVTNSNLGKGLRKKKRRIRYGTYKLPGSKKANKKKEKLIQQELGLNSSLMPTSDVSGVPLPGVAKIEGNKTSSSLVQNNTDGELVSQPPCEKQGLSSKPDEPEAKDELETDKTLGMPKGKGVNKKKRRQWACGQARKWRKKYLLQGQKTLDQMANNVTPVSLDQELQKAVIENESALAAPEVTSVQEENTSLNQVKASLDSLAARRSLRKRKATADSEDASSVVSMATSNAESDNMQAKKRLKQEEEENHEATPSLSPVTTPVKNGTGTEDLPPPTISPQKPIPQIKGPGQAKSKLDKMIYTHPLHGNPDLLKQQAALVEGQEPSVADTAVEEDDLPMRDASGLPSGAQHALKFVNTPNGISYPVTPPKTPETGSGVVHHAAMQARKSPIAKERDFIPLCLCRINGTSFTNLTGVVYCQALDSIDGKVIGCCNKVANALLVRPAVKIPFMAVCEIHRKRLRQHQCCPGCGHFCTQGKFFQCKKEGAAATHHFHRQCQVFKDNKYYCPHCGEESSQYEVNLKLQTPRHASFFIKEESQTKTKGKAVGPRAKMGFSKKSELMENEEQQAGEDTLETSETAPGDDEKRLSSDGHPFGPDKADLESILNVLNMEKTKKLRVGPKNVYHACKSNDMEKLVSLLGEGFDPNTKFEDFNNQTALHAAAAAGNVALVHVLLQAGASPHNIDSSLRTPLMEAAENGHIEIMKYLIRAGATVDIRAEDGMSTLHLAAKSGSLDTIQFLLETKKIDVNVKDDGGWTPIIWASEHRYLDAVKFLLTAGADPNMRDNEENTALHWAAYAGSVDIAELFLNAGSDLEAANEHGDRALHIAARQDHYECVVLFLARGADSEARNNENEAPISCCAEQNSQVWMALRVNRQLKGIANKQLKRPERLLHRDISMGMESNPIPVVNDIDEENYPQDFVYVIENCETTPMNINRCITSLQYCRCKDDCSSMFCVCGRNSVRCWYDKEGRLVKDFNQVEPPLVFECNKACRCWSNCQNRVVQLGITCRLQVFRTPGRGWGCRTLLDIPQGTFICEYIGEHISDAEADSREDDSYLFDLDNKDSDTFCIDARRYGNVSRFINHLCEPNLIPVKVFVDHQDLRFPRICFFASRDIKAMEELGFDYGEKFWIIKWKQFTCACASPKCKYSSDMIQQTIADYNRRQMEEDGEVE